MNNVINVAVIGFGFAGRVFHSPILSSLKHFQIIKVYTSSPDNIAMAKSLYPSTECVSDIKAVMVDERTELVVIAAPNTQHFALAKEALEAGKHVVIDKPFTVTSQEADELIKLSEKQGRVLSAYQNRRWDSDFQTVKKVVESGVLGTLVECEIHMDRYRKSIKERAWREEAIPGSGLLYDLGSHLIDQALVLFGAPDAVTADLRMQRPSAKNIDSFELILHYPKLKVTLKSGMLVRAELPRYILLGENGSFVKYGLDIQEEDLKSGLTPLTKANWGEEPETLYGTINTTVKGLDISGRVKSEPGDYRRYYENIYHAIHGQEELIVTPFQAKAVIRIIEYAMESHDKKCTVDVIL